MPLPEEPEQVGPPDREDARIVLGRVRVLARELELPGLQLLDDVLPHRSPGGRRVVAQVERVAVEGRVGRHPAHARALGDHVGGGLPGQLARAGGGRQRVRTELVVAELVGVEVPVRRLDHVARRAVPVQGVGDLGVAGDRPHLLLPDVVGPATAVDALAAGEVGQRQERPVDRVGVEPVVGAGSHHDHGAPLRLLRVLRELATDPRGRGGGDTGDHLLPGRRVRRARVVVRRRPLAGQAGTPDAVLRQQQVEHGGHQVARDAPDRHAPREVRRGAVGGVEARHAHDDRLLRTVQQREQRVDVTELEVPPADTRVAVPVTQRAVRDDGLTRAGVDQDCLEGGVLVVLVVRQVGGCQELARGVLTVGGLLQTHEVGQVGVALDVLGEVRRLPVDEELLEHHVAHRHRERGVCPGSCRQPLVGELHVVGVVRRDRDHLLTAIPRLRHPVRIRRPRHRQVRAPHDQVAGVPPVARLGHVGLVPEHLRRGHREVGVPVVEAQHGATDEVDETSTGRVRDHRHRRDRGEARDPVGTVLLDRVDVGGRDDLRGLVPGRADQTALPARRLVGLGALRVLHDVLPRAHRVSVVLGLGLAEHLQQDSTHVGVPHACRGVGVPGERRAPGTAPRLVLGRVGTDRRIVRLLGLPGDDPVLDVDLPRAGPGAVDTVRGTHHLVVTPPVAVEVVRGTTADLGQRPQVLRDGSLGEEPPAAHQRFLQRAVQADVALLGHDASCFSACRSAVRRTTVSVSTSVPAAVIASSHSPMA